MPWLIFPSGSTTMWKFVFQMFIPRKEVVKNGCLQQKGPSIYDLHTEGEGVRLRWTHVDGGGGQAPGGRPHRNLKLESTDVILSPHARKLASFYQNFVFGRNKTWTFFGDIN